MLTPIVLASCAQPVAIPAPTPASSQISDICDLLSRSLPLTVLGQQRRTIDPTSIYTAAWGNPPITFRCGVPAPAGLTPTSQLISVNNVAWYAEQRSQGYLFNTVGRVATIEIAVPNTYRPETNALVDFATAVSTTDPVTKS